MAMSLIFYDTDTIIGSYRNSYLEAQKAAINNTTRATSSSSPTTSQQQTTSPNQTQGINLTTQTVAGANNTPTATVPTVNTPENQTITTPLNEAVATQATNTAVSTAENTGQITNEATQIIQEQTPNNVAVLEVNAPNVPSEQTATVAEQPKPTTQEQTIQATIAPSENVVVQVEAKIETEKLANNETQTVANITAETTIRNQDNTETKTVTTETVVLDPNESLFGEAWKGILEHIDQISTVLRETLAPRATYSYDARDILKEETNKQINNFLMQAQERRTEVDDRWKKFVEELNLKERKVDHEKVKARLKEELLQIQEQVRLQQFGRKY